MGFFTGQTKVVDLGGGNTATLRKATFADVAKAQSAAAHWQDDKLVLDWPIYRLELVKATLTAWSGPDFEGQPPTAENIAALPPSGGEKLAKEAQSLSSLDDDEGN